MRGAVRTVKELFEVVDADLLWLGGRVLFPSDGVFPDVPRSSWKCAVAGGKTWRCR